MRIRTNQASRKSIALVEKITSKLEGLKKPGKKFIKSLIILFLSMRGRYTFKGMERYGSLCEKSYRLHFERGFDFLEFNSLLCKASLSKHRIVVFDPSYLPKSGKHTPGKGNFYSGSLGRAIGGIEIGCLAAVDINEQTAISLEAIQTPNSTTLESEEKSLIDHYANIIIERADQLKEISSYLAVDGYFSKKSFVDPIDQQTSLYLVGKLRKDANLKYLYKGPRRKGRGRPRKYAGKVDTRNIDKRRINWVYQDEHVILYQAIVWSVFLKRNINLVYAQFLDNGRPTDRYALFYSTDLELEGELVYQYYKARFQIEFLFRDAKQHTGLTHCQARSEKKLHFHFNASLTAVGVAKIAHYFKGESSRDDAFSLANIKTLYFNELILNLFLSNFQIDMNLKKNKSAVNYLLKFGRIAA